MAGVRHETRLLLRMLGRVRLWDVKRKARQSLRRLEALRVVAGNGARSLSVLIEVDVDILDNAMDVYVVNVAILGLQVVVHGSATILVVAVALEAAVVRRVHRLLLRVEAARVSKASLLATAKLNVWLAKYLGVLQFVLNNELVDLLRTVRRYDDVSTGHERLVTVSRSRGTADSAHFLLLDHFPLGD